MHKVPSRLLCLLIAALLIPSVAAAQPGAQDPVPRELAHALLRAIQMDTSDVQVGRVAASLPAAIFPSDATVHGSYTIGSLRSITVVSIPGERAALFDAMGQRLRADGWRTVENVMPERTGFSSASRFPPRGGRGAVPTNLQMCRDAEVIRLSATAAGAATDAMTVEHLRGTRLPPCSNPADETPPRSPLPLLEHPLDVVATGGGGSGSSGGGGAGFEEFDSHARVSAEQPPATLISHYAAQLSAAGWIPIDSAASDKLASRTFRLIKPDSGGTWEALLTAYRPGGDNTMQLMISGRKLR